MANICFLLLSAIFFFLSPFDIAKFEQSFHWLLSLSAISAVKIIITILFSFTFLYPSYTLLRLKFCRSGEVKDCERLAEVAARS